LREAEEEWMERGNRPMGRGTECRDSFPCLRDELLPAMLDVTSWTVKSLIHGIKIDSWKKRRRRRKMMMMMEEM
jgi:hypothetical protein